MHCGICDNREGNRPFQAREMMFGYRELFTYLQCAKCGCLQLMTIPEDMSRYYPSNYYSLSEQDRKQPEQNSLDWCHTMLGGPIIPTLFNMANSKATEQTLIKKVVVYYFSSMKLSRRSRILDVGCGSGSFLRALSTIGFLNLLGVDPYAEHTVYDDGTQVVRGTIFSLDPEPTWDIIMFHHSLEHMPDQIETLRAVSRLLSPDGICLVRIPVVLSYAWEHYGMNWVGIDAPRHLYIHSIESLRIAAAQAGLYLKDILYDSTSLQFWGSEQYLRDIPLYSERSFTTNPFTSIFTLSQIDAFEQRARALNKEQRGDQAVFYLARQ